MTPRPESDVLRELEATRPAHRPSELVAGVGLTWLLVAAITGLLAI